MKKDRKEYLKEYRKKYNKTYGPNNRERLNKNTREYFRRLRVTILSLLGDKCVRCGFSDPRALQIDHINGGGTKEKKELKTSFNKLVLLSLANNEGRYQLLCANCNWIKRVERQEVGGGYRRKIKE